jgi:hypothetical protein
LNLIRDAEQKRVTARLAERAGARHRTKPVGDKHILAAGDNPRLIACQLLRRGHNASRNIDWGSKITYPRVGKI